MALLKQVVLVSFLFFGSQLQAAVQGSCPALFPAVPLSKTDVTIVAGVLTSPQYDQYMANLLSTAQGKFTSENAVVKIENNGEFQFSVDVIYTLSPGWGSRDRKKEDESELQSPLVVEVGTLVVKGTLNGDAVSVTDIQQVDISGAIGWQLPVKKGTSPGRHTDAFFSRTLERAFAAAALKSGEIEKHHRKPIALRNLYVLWYEDSNTAFIYANTDREIVIQGHLDDQKQAVIANAFTKPRAGMPSRE